MSEYLVLARKWRPQKFDALIGQDHVARALTNALESGRIPHAFLFTGIRGVGKTTLARLLAKCLNCEDKVTAQPCGECDSCLGVNAGNQVDVMEIDAASRTKVDQMREVLDTVVYAPASSRFKVYIMDEVHMLTVQSFNALLKTLEEPPGHVKFIFATTDVRKLPATILSRCQRFDLKRITRPVLTDYLAHILREEKISFDGQGLAAVVRAADGSVRDALSMLEQVVAHGEGAVRFDRVGELLGLTDSQAVRDLIVELFAGAADKVLASAGKFYESGVDPVILVGDILAGIHRAARYQVLAKLPEDEKDDVEAVALYELGERMGMETLQMVYQVLLRGVDDVKKSDSPLATLEMLLLRVAYLKPIPGLEGLITALKKASPPFPPARLGASPQRSGMMSN